MGGAAIEIGEGRTSCRVPKGHGINVRLLSEPLKPQLEVVTAEFPQLNAPRGEPVPGEAIKKVPQGHTTGAASGTGPVASVGRSRMMAGARL
jgi:hypothetical protein